jgi:hypothetical protein
VKLRLNTRYFRPRSTMWVSCIMVLVFLFKGIETFFDNSLNNVTLISFSGVLLFGFISVLGILTYKDKCLLKDTNRWNNKGAWKNEGVKSKLKVISDWIVN